MGQWEGISEFVAVAQSQSFTSAATRLTTSVAQISRKVAALESRLAVKLLNRTTRKVTLTEAGQLFFNQCKHLVEGLEQAERAVTRMQLEPEGLIKLTAPVTYGEMNLAPLLTRFLKRHPQIDLELVLTNQKLDLQDSGIDLAIRLGRLEDSSLVARRLSDRQLYVCASREYLEKHGEPHTLSELDNHVCLRGNLDHWRFTENGQDRSIRVRGRMKCNSGFALKEAAMQGIGLVQLPDYYVQQDLEQGTLVEVLGQYRCEREGIWALYPKNRYLPSKIKTLLAFLETHLSGQSR